MRKRLSRRTCIAPTTAIAALLLPVFCPTASASPPEPTTQQRVPPTPVDFGAWRVLDTDEEIDRADSDAWRVRADHVRRSANGWKLAGAVRAVSETTIVAAEHARLTSDGLVADDASIYVDGARFDARIAELDARSDRVRLDRPGDVRPHPRRRGDTPEE